jgi:hypothetical protein
LITFNTLAAVVSPGVGVLVELQVVVHGLAIDFHCGCQASFTEAHFVCAMINVWDLAGAIIFGIVLEVERFITHWRTTLIADGAHRHLVVNVKVLRAALFACTINTATTMPCHHCLAVGVALVVFVSKVVLVMALAEVMSCAVVQPIFRLHIDTVGFHLGPLAIVINLLANSATMVVVLCAGLVDAILGSTLGKEFFLGVVMEEDIHVAFDLLGS